MFEHFPQLLLQILTPFLVLGVVIVVHELGHFQVARWLGVAVERFSVGFGNAIWKRTDKHGVEWWLSSIPLGGYVKFKGDADVSSSGPAEPIQDGAALAAARRAGLFHAQPVWKRAAVTAAGPLANFVLAILVIAMLAMIVGVQRPAVGQVMEGSAAARAGLQTGDVIRAIDGDNVLFFDDVRERVSAAPGATMRFEIQRGGETIERVITVDSVSATVNGREAQQGRLGVAGGDVLVGRAGPIEAVAHGVEKTGWLLAKTLGYLGKILSGQDDGSQISGPVGIFKVTGEGAKSAVSVEGDLAMKIGALAWSMTLMVAVLSVAVGFANLLPIPILDGGHLVYYALEAVRGRPLSPQVQEWGARAGLAVLLSLFLFATWNDFSRPNPLEFLF